MRVMRLIDEEIGMFECRVCKDVALGIPDGEGQWEASSYLCENGCIIEKKGGKNGKAKAKARSKP